VHFNLVDNCLKTLTTALYLMLIYLFYSNFCMGTDIAHCTHCVIARLCKIYNAERTLTK